MKGLVIILLALLFLSVTPFVLAAPPLPGSLTKDAIEGWCYDQGGTYWPPGPESSTYGCILPDGSVVVCGGSGQGCDVLEASAGLPSSKLALAGINVTIGVQTQTRLDLLQDKMDLIEQLVEDVAVLVEDECEPPIFVP